MSSPIGGMFKVYVLGTLAAGLLALLNLTLRGRRSGLAANNEYWADQGPKIIAFWHESQLCMPFAYGLLRRVKPHTPQVYTLISAHTDGRLIAWAVKLLGLDSVAGSSTRGGAEGVRAMIACTERGQHVAITPDGPRGPRHKAKRGAVVIARETGLPLCPVAIFADRAWVFGSWDRMFLPKPFARISVHCGQALLVPRDLPDSELGKMCEELDRRLEEAGKEAAHAFTA